MGLCKGTLELPLPYPVRQQQSLHLGSLKTKFETPWNDLSFCNRLLVTNWETATRKALRSKEFNLSTENGGAHQTTLSKAHPFSEGYWTSFSLLASNSFCWALPESKEVERHLLQARMDTEMLFLRCLHRQALSLPSQQQHFLHCQWWQGGKRDRQICTSSCLSSPDRVCRRKR